MIATDLVQYRYVGVVVEVSSSTDRVLDCCVHHHKNGGATFFFIRWTDKYVLSNPENDVEYGNNLLPFGDDDVFDVVYRIPGSTGYRLSGMMMLCTGYQGVPDTGTFRQYEVYLSPQKIDQSK
jgi:hypothetical protein